MKITDFGVAIIESDTHLSRWIQEQRTLAVADGFCRLFTPYIPKGGVVLDVGACLGDHTVTYADMVGPTGTVHAFEPNPEAYECLRHNTASRPNVHRHHTALGAGLALGSCVASNESPNNLGATQFREGTGGIPIQRLDAFAQHWSRVDFIKIDAEGYEPDIIAGAMETLRRLRPVLLVEINRPLLAARGKSDADILRPLAGLGYTVMPCEPHLSMDMEQIDILCLPRK